MNINSSLVNGLCKEAPPPPPPRHNEKKKHNSAVNKKEVLRIQIDA